MQTTRPVRRRGALPRSWSPCTQLAPLTSTGTNEREIPPGSACPSPSLCLCLSLSLLFPCLCLCLSPCLSLCLPCLQKTFSCKLRCTASSLPFSLARSPGAYSYDPSSFQTSGDEMVVASSPGHIIPSQCGPGPSHRRLPQESPIRCTSQSADHESKHAVPQTMQKGSQG